MKYVDVVIVGGAVVGSAAAYFLRAQTGFKGSVLVVEKDFTYEHSATARSAASIRHQFSTPENIRMSQFGSHFIQNIGDYLAVDGEVPDLGFHEGGYLFLATPAGRDVLEANHRVQRSLGVDVALLAPAQLQVRFPWLNTSDLSAGSLGLSGEGWLDAFGLMQAFRRKAVSLGAEYQQAQVSAVQRAGRAITAVTLSDGATVSCGLVINAAGTGAPALAQSAGIFLPVQSRKRCVFFFSTPAEVSQCPLVIDPSGGLKAVGSFAAFRRLRTRTLNALISRWTTPCSITCCGPRWPPACPASRLPVCKMLGLATMTSIRWTTT